MERLTAKFAGTRAVPTEEITDITGPLPGDVGREDPGYLRFTGAALGRSILTPLAGVGEVLGLADEGTTARRKQEFEEEQAKFLEGGASANARATYSFLARLAADAVPMIGGGAAAKTATGGAKLALKYGMSEKAAQFLGGALPGAIEGGVIGLGETADATPAERVIATTLGTVLGGSAAGLIRLKGGAISTDPLSQETHPRIAKLVSALQSKRGRPQEVHDEITRRIGHTRAALLRVAEESKRFDEVYSKTVSRASAAGVPKEKLDHYVSQRLLKGEDPGLYPELVAPAKRLREHVDEMSRALREDGVAGPEGSTLYDVIEQNEGGYVARTFAALENDVRDWPKEVLTARVYDPEADQVRSAWDWAHEYISEDLAREGIEASPDEVFDLMHRLAVRDKDGFEAVGKSGKLVREYTDLFKKRKEIPEPVRALMGEEQDPIANYYKTVMRQSVALEEFKLAKTIRDNYEGQLFWRSRSDVKAALEASGRGFELDDIVEVPELETGIFRGAAEGGGSEVLQGAEKGFFTTKTIKDIVFRADEQIKGNALQFANSFSKVMATIYSPQTHARNFMANNILLIMNGHSPHNLLRRQGRKGFSVFRLRTGKTPVSVSDQDFLVEAAKRGVIGEDTRAGDLEFYNKMMDRFLEQGNHTATAKIAKKALDNRVGRFAKGAYMAEDEVFKLTMWGREMEQYRAALPHLSDDELMDMTAKIVRNQLPTYSQVPKLGEWLRRNPVGGTFISFPMEIVRNTKNALKQGLIEVGSEHAGVKLIGAKRLGGTLTALSLPGVVQHFYRMRSGAPTQLEEESLRAHVRPWDKSDQLVITSIDREKGDVTYFNTSFMDSLGQLKAPFLAAMGHAFNERGRVGAAGAAREIADTYFGPEIAATAFIEALSNRKGLPFITGRQGGDVYSQEADVIQRLYDSGKHVARAFTPGAIKSAERITRGVSGTQAGKAVGMDGLLKPFNNYGTEYKIENEILALAGPRVTTINVPDSMRYRISSFRRKREEALKVYNRVDNPNRISSPPQLEKARGQANRIYEKAFDELYLAVESSRNLGMEDIEIVKLLRRARVSKKDVHRILTGSKKPLIVKSAVRRRGV